MHSPIDVYFCAKMVQKSNNTSQKTFYSTVKALESHLGHEIFSQKTNLNKK